MQWTGNLRSKWLLSEKLLALWAEFNPLTILSTNIFLIVESKLWSSKNIDKQNLIKSSASCFPSDLCCAGLRTQLWACYLLTAGSHHLTRPTQIASSLPTRLLLHSRVIWTELQAESKMPLCSQLSSASAGVVPKGYRLFQLQTHNPEPPVLLFGLALVFAGWPRGTFHL